ncbi:expressed unknown protein [Seminavis robusta]|uniref:Uncharacterized protein n=1 Tax=Seminavis robusta TaxID=568900 RepID=A0A9N8EIJ6_9STRA|nr:expressed unknown protein [Seminavis robusta]|eukprot:Sro1255_g256540.1 n/a (363) ;mRNA; r:30742-31830
MAATLTQNRSVFSQSHFGRSNHATGDCDDASPSGATTGCYLYYESSSFGNARVTTGPRMADPLTAQAENMTKEEFAAFQKENVDRVTEKFMEETRHAILSQNENGELLNHRISPSVLTDDWVLRATEFVKEICEQPLDQRATISLAMTEKIKRGYSEGWLVVKAMGPHPLPVVMFTTREGDFGLMGCLDSIMAQLHQVLSHSFPYCDVSPLQTTKNMWSELARELEEPDRDIAGRGLKDAMERIEVLKRQGASKVDIKAEMQRLRTIRRGRLVAKNPISDADKERMREEKDKKVDSVSTGKLKRVDSVSTGKLKRRSFWDALVVSKQHYWKTYGRTWAWTGLVAAVALYYVYWLMRPVALPR